MRTRRNIFVGLVAAAALLVASAARVHAAPAKKIKYHEVAPSVVKISPRGYEGKYIKIKDYFGRALDEKKSRDDRWLWKRDWVRGQRMSSKNYLAFFTDRDDQGSNMLCYVPLSNKAAVELVQGLAEDDRILIKGQLKVHELGDKLNESDITHFIVDSIKLDHDEEEVETRLFVSVGKTRAQIPRSTPVRLVAGHNDWESLILQAERSHHLNRRVAKAAAIVIKVGGNGDERI